MPASTSIIAAVVVTTSLVSAAPQAKQQSKQQAERIVADRIAAVIEDQIITLRELEKKAEPYMAPLADIKDAKEREQRRQQILRQVLDIEIGERIVDRELAQNRERLGVTDQDVDRAVQEVLRMNNLNEDQLQAALYGQGLTWSEYRKKLRDQIERARLVQFRVQGKVQVGDADVKRRCEERQRAEQREQRVCASHVLLRVPPEASPEEVDRLRVKASQLQSELAAGGDFAAYALRYSDDKGAPGGQLGCFGRGEMVEAFEKAAFALAPGQVSQVVRTEFGFHVIKVTERRTAAASSCEDEQALGQYRNEIYQEEMERQMNAWMQELRQKAFVEVRL